MTTNRLAKPVSEIQPMTAARAQKFVRWASEKGDHVAAARWQAYATELAKAERVAGQG